MADISISTKASADAVMAQKALIVTQLKAGATIAKGKAVYLKSDGKVWLADKDVLNDESISQFLGIANADYVAGEAITVFGMGNVISDYSTGLTPGASLYVSDSGVLADAAVAVNDTPVALCLSATDILIIR